MTCSQLHGRNLFKTQNKKQCLWGGGVLTGLRVTFAIKNETELKGCHQVFKLPIAGFAVCWLISLSWGLFLTSVSHRQVFFFF